MGMLAQARDRMDARFRVSTSHESRVAMIQKLPPGLTISQVARRLQRSNPLARYWGHEAGYAFRRSAKRGIPPERWRTVDWSMRDCRIAELLGIGRERVRQVRLRERQPKAHPPRRSPSEILQAIKHLPPQLTIPEAASRLHLSYEYAMRLLRRAGYAIRRVGTSYPSDWWRHVDWTLPNVSIARAVGACPTTVASMRQRLGKPKLDRWWKVLPEQWRRVDWSQSNAAIAESMGISLVYVRLKRRLRARSTKGKQA